MPYCAVCRKVKKGRRHRLPNPNRTDLVDVWDQWIRFIDRPEYAELPKKYLYDNISLCELHFKPDDFTTNLNGRLLKYLAVPSIYISDNMPVELENLQQSAEISDVPENENTISILPIDPSLNYAIPGTSSSSDVLNEETDMPGRESRLSYVSSLTESSNSTVLHKKKKIKVLQKALGQKYRHTRALKRKLKLAENLETNNSFQKLLRTMHPNAANFFKCQIREAGKSKKGQRFTTNEKIFALTLYKLGQKSYRHYQQIFSLPSPTTIARLLKRLSLKVGINNVMIDYLKTVAAGLSPQDRHCAILFDEIFLMPGLKYDVRNKEILGFEENSTESSIKIADHAIVFMVKGLQKNWKFPFAFYFSESGMKTIPLVKIIKDVVRSVQSCNLNVMALVCDQGANNVAAINYLKKEAEEKCNREGKTYNGWININDKKIYGIFDVPHLLKGTRNNLLNYDLVFKMEGVERKACWKHVVQLYEEDRNKIIRAVPKLNDCHILKDKIQKMKVKYCSQVFSQRVASQMLVLSEYAPENVIDSGAGDTAYLINFFDQLFDSLNSSNYFAKGKSLKCAVTKTTTHMEFWKKAIVILNSMYFLKNGKKFIPPTIKNWQLTIRNVINLWEDLQEKGYKYFLTRRVNQDPLENFFSAVRGLGRFNHRPTTIQFIAAFKTLIINNVSSRHSINANCEKDGSFPIQKSLKLLLNIGSKSQDRKTRISKENLDSTLSLQPSDLNYINNFNLMYFSGYLLKKCYDIFHNCSDCTDALTTSENVLHTLIEKREQNPIKKLNYPSIGFKNIINDMKSVIESTLPYEFHSVQNIYMILENVEFDFWNCELHKNQIKKFVINKVADILIYKWCHNINLILNGKFRIGTDVSDPVKRYAFEKYNKLFCKIRR